LLRWKDAVDLELLVTGARSPAECGTVAEDTRELGIGLAGVSVTPLRNGQSLPGGSGPLVVEGFRSSDTPVMNAYQTIYNNGVPGTPTAVGEFEFDTRPGHEHWHLEDIAQYDLLDSTGARVVLSEKQSFCLAPTDPIDLLAAGANWQPDRAGLWSACAGEDSIWLREVLPAGWGDTYFQGVAGQSFDITSLPNGHYQLRGTTDPFHKLLETTYSDNASVVGVDIGGTPGNRTVLAS